MSKKKIFGTALIFVVLVSVIFFVVLSDNKESEEKEVEQTEEIIDNYLNVEYDGVQYAFNQNVSTVLFLGVDGDQGEYLSGQSDFMSLAVFNKEDKKISLISIPRDSMVDIAKYDDEGNYEGDFEGQITLAYPYGGNSPSACARNSINSVSTMLNGILLDHYITIPLNSLDDLVDTFGEMDIILEDDSLSYKNPEYVKGYSYHLDKTTIETYLRGRDCDQNYSAYYRLLRQQIYLKRCLDELVEIFDGNSSTSLEKVLSLLEDCNSNLTSAQIERYIDYFKEYKENGVEFYTIPGEQRTTSKFEEYIIDRDALNQMIIELFYK